MTDPAAKAEILRSLRRLVRGLSALFWGLPFTLLVSVQNAVTDWLRPLGMLPPLAGALVLFLGVRELGFFQRQERVWTQAVERAQLLALVNLGLTPFVFFWSRLPHIPFYLQMVGLLALGGLLFLLSLNCLLQRLTAMLPDVSLREDTRLFTSLNLMLMLAVVGLLGLYYVLTQIDSLPLPVIRLLDFLFAARRALLVLLVLLPVAMTMTLLWKTKEVVLSGVFGVEQ